MGHLLSAQELLRLPVRLRGITLGRPADLVLDPEATRVVGVEVVCGDDGRRFLPLAAARIREDELAVGSPLLLLDEGDLAFYRRRGRALSSLRGAEIVRSGRIAGTLADILIGEDGAVALLEVESVDRAGTSRRRIRPGPRVTIGRRGRATAA